MNSPPTVCSPCDDVQSRARCDWSIYFFALEICVGARLRRQHGWILMDVTKLCKGSRGNIFDPILAADPSRHEGEKATI